VTTGIAAHVRVVAGLGGRSVRTAFRRPQFLAPILIFPSLFLAVNTGGAGRAVDIPGFPAVNGFLDFQLAGAMLQSTMLAGVTGGIALAIDIEMGFIDRLLAAPISRWTVVVGRLAATWVLGLIAAVWFLTIGFVFGATVEGGVGGVLLVLLLVPLAALAFGGLGAALALGTGRTSVVQSIFPLVFVILFLSSAFFPQHLLLEPASSIASWNPLTLVANGLRDPIVTGVSGEALLDALGGIAIVGALAFALSALGLRRRLRAA
jgi:ABC-2 type transport system permease protein